MKRTKEHWNKPQPPAEDRTGISGLKEFDGEDLSIIFPLLNMNDHRFRCETKIL